MTEGRSFPFPGLGSKRSSYPADAYAEFLETFPHGAAVIDERSRRIETVNERLCAITGQTAAELTGQIIDVWLPGWESGFAPVQTAESLSISQKNSQPNARSALAGGVTLPLARITRVPFAPKGKRILIVQVPSKTEPGSGRLADLTGFWNYLERLAETRQILDGPAALQAALDSARELTGAETLAVYRVETNQPALKLHTAIAAEGILPDVLPAQELIQLNRPRAWEAGRRPVSGLQRLARAAQLTYLVSAPLGQEHALIGLVLLGGTQPPATGLEEVGAERSIELLLPVVRLLATVITGIFQQQSRVDVLEGLQAIQAREGRLDAALESYAYEGMLVLDAGLNLLRLNPAAELMMGYASAEVGGQHVDKVLIGPEALLPALKEALDGSPTYNLGNVRLFRRNGESFLALMRIYPITHAGLVEQVLVLIQDLSEQEQIRLQQQNLEQRALLGEVTAVFAHEVRNPINNISTGLQVMQMNLPPDDPNQAAITRMLADCDRLAELLKSVLAYSKPADYEMEPLDIGGLLNRLLERLHPRIVRQNVQYNLRVEDDCPQVMGNLRALEQVFNNLIGNALQAMGATGGNLIIKAWGITENGEKSLEVSIADTGPGIPRENLERVFQPFFTTEKGGTGLGLAITKRIVTAHKGIIKVTSFPGGTIFRVRLPVIEET